jgi:DNA-directed RNA polymerase subunit L
LSDPDVVFAGYKVPHPLKHVTVVKVQTNHNSSPGTHAVAVGSEEVQQIKLNVCVCVCVRGGSGGDDERAD